MVRYDEGMPMIREALPPRRAEHRCTPPGVNPPEPWRASTYRDSELWLAYLTDEDWKNMNPPPSVEGAVWQCDECLQFWAGGIARGMLRHPAWTKVSDRRAKKILRS